MKSNKLKILLPIAAVVLLVGLGIAIYGIIPRKVAADHTTTSVAQFTFDASKAPGWFAADPIGPTSSDGSANPWTAARNLAQGTVEHPTGNCSVMLFYYANSSTDPTAALKVKTDGKNDDGTPALQPTNTVSYTMALSGGDQTYQMHQYNLVSNPSSPMERGNEFGYLRAGTGYIEIQGYCATADDLAITNPVFSAIGFKQ